MITNLPCLARLSRDCSKTHAHLTVGFDKDIRTKAVEPYAPQLVRVWAKLLADFVKAPSSERCTACAAADSDSQTRDARVFALRRAERFGLSMELCDWVDDGLRTCASGEVIYRLSVARCPGPRGDGVSGATQFFRSL